MTPEEFVKSLDQPGRDGRDTVTIPAWRYEELVVADGIVYVLQKLYDGLDEYDFNKAAGVIFNKKEASENA